MKRKREINESGEKSIGAGKAILAQASTRHASLFFACSLDGEQMALGLMLVAISAGSALPWRAAHCSLALARWRRVEHALVSIGNSEVDHAGAPATSLARQSAMR